MVVLVGVVVLVTVEGVVVVSSAVTPTQEHAEMYCAGLEQAAA